MDWNTFIKEEEMKDYFKKLKSFVENEYKTKVCYPSYDNIYEAFKLTPFDKVKVVILGQDPYHEENQAHGLSFSVLCEKLPPSLKNIYKEMASDLNVSVNQDGDLSYLAVQGVLLLNTTLTVEAHKANSHSKKGWDIFTDNVIKELNNSNNPIVFILWGNNSREKVKLITNPIHCIIESAHPSPLSAYHGFFGSRPFSRANEFLIKNNIEPIKWYK
ncbi:MAG: uracil-DNA glycosylase [Acholeplasmatales bacterium]|nr:uracil-DNA glycosylase [Acholeplasmatales bacterium]